MYAEKRAEDERKMLEDKSKYKSNLTTLSLGLEKPVEESSKSSRYSKRKSKQSS